MTIQSRISRKIILSRTIFTKATNGPICVGIVVWIFSLYPFIRSDFAVLFFNHFSNILNTGIADFRFWGDQLTFVLDMNKRTMLTYVNTDHCFHFEWTIPESRVPKRVIDWPSATNTSHYGVGLCFKSVLLRKMSSKGFSGGFTSWSNNSDHNATSYWWEVIMADGQIRNSEEPLNRAQRTRTGWKKKSFIF